MQYDRNIIVGRLGTLNGYDEKIGDQRPVGIAIYIGYTGIGRPAVELTKKAVEKILKK